MTIKQLDNPTPTQTPMRFTFRPQLQMIFWFKIPPPQILPSFFTIKFFFFEIHSIGDHENVKNLAQNLAYAYALHCWRPRDIFQFSIFDLSEVDIWLFIFSNAKNLHFCYLSSKYRLSSCPLLSLLKMTLKWPWGQLKVFSLIVDGLICQLQNTAAKEVFYWIQFFSLTVHFISVQKMCQNFCVTHYLSHFYSVNIFWLTILINNPINGYFWFSLRFQSRQKKTRKWFYVLWTP